MKRAVTIAVFTATCVLSDGVAAEAPDNALVTSGVINLSSSPDTTRMFANPEGPFVILRFPENALGDHIGVVYYERMGNPADGAWSFANRF